MTSIPLNPAILEPLFAPWQGPNAHRVRAEQPGDPAVVKQGRRASPIEVVNNLWAAVREWREAFCIGARDTTLQEGGVGKGAVELIPSHFSGVGSAQLS